jgi:hypothetical protein
MRACICSFLFYLQINNIWHSRSLLGLPVLQLHFVRNRAGFLRVNYEINQVVLGVKELSGILSKSL